MKFMNLLLVLNIFMSGTALPLPETENSVKLPVLMYHRLLRCSTANDPYTITPSAFEQDLTYLSENGYTTIGTQELLDFVELGVPLPEKPVMLTFDDGHYNNLHYAVPLLERFGMKAVIFVVGEYSERSELENEQNPNYSYIRWESMKSLSSAVEIQSHTWGMHRLNGARNGIKRKYGESRCDYEIALRGDLLKLNDKVALYTGRTPAAFALPFGAEEEWARDVLDSVGIKMCFCSRSGVTVLKSGDTECLHNIRRLVRRPDRSAAALLKKYMS